MSDAVDLDLAPNEASDLARVPDGVLPGWDHAYVTVLDEGVAEDSVAVLGHRGADLAEGWEARRLHLRPERHAGRTDDAEAAAFHDGWLWLLGSQYGSKDGPLQARRAWIARMAERDLPAAVAGARAPLQIARTPFVLHRAVNDALREAGLALRPLGRDARRALVGAAVERGREKGKRWRERVHGDDHPINVEGMEFRADGALLLGLRYPVTADGEPILVELGGADALFADRDAPLTARAVWTLRCAGAGDDPVGVRGLHRSRNDDLHVVVGSLDAEGKDSALLADEAAGGHAHCAHWRVRLPLTAAGGPLTAELVEDFPDLKTVEGIAETPDGHFLYVIDRDHQVHLRFLYVE